MFRRTNRADNLAPLYEAIVKQARQPEFYSAMGVPDTVDGRFDMVTLHAFLVIRRLRGDDTLSDDLSQALFDYMFDDMDRSLRELGAGDLGVGRRVKAMAMAFYGRAAAYEEGLAASGPELADALRRNLYRNVSADDAAVAAMAEYVRREAAGLALTGRDDIEAGQVGFGTVSNPADGPQRGQEARP